MEEASQQGLCKNGRGVTTRDYMTQLHRFHYNGLVFSQRIISHAISFYLANKCVQVVLPGNWLRQCLVAPYCIMSVSCNSILYHVSVL